MKDNQRVLYMNPSGRDQWITLKQDEKKIELIDIQSGIKETIPFLSKRDAKVNFSSWLEHQEVRLPKTFIVETKEYISGLYASLRKLNLEVPPKKKLKDYLIYHKSEKNHICMTIENFQNSLLPIIDLVYLNRVAKNTQIRRINESMHIINTGLFEKEAHI